MPYPSWVRHRLETGNSRPREVVRSARLRYLPSRARFLKGSRYGIWCALMDGAAPKRGRPSLYSEAIADEIVEWIEEGKTLSSYCRQEGKPKRRTIDDWRNRDAAFSARVARARDDGFTELAEQCLAIADTPCPGEIITEEQEGPDGTTTKRKVVREDMLGHRKLQVETRLKLLACWDPKRYGNQPVKVDIAETAAAIQAFIVAARAQDEAEGSTDG